MTCKHKWAFVGSSPIPDSTARISVYYCSNCKVYENRTPEGRFQYNNFRQKQYLLTLLSKEKV